MSQRSGSGGGRRRRVLTEQVIGEPAAAPEEGAGGGDATPYDEAALAGLPGISDLVPRRFLTISFFFLLAVLAAVGLSAAHAYLPELARYVRPENLAPFDLTAQASLAAWFGSMLWALSALLVLVIYGIRRQKLDDYHGRYRVWRWAAAIALLAASDRVASWHRALDDAVVYCGQRLGHAELALWWPLPVGLVLVLIGIRLLLDIRPCRGAVVVLTLAAVTAMAAVGLRLGLVRVTASASAAPLAVATGMAAQCLALLALLLYGRHVVLEAAGERTARPPRKRRPARPRAAKKAKKKSEPKSSGPVDKKDAAEARRTRKVGTSKRVKIDAAHVAPSEPVSQVTESDSDDDASEWIDGSELEDSGGNGRPAGKKRRLSKSERKRLRREQARQRQ